jgi:hypothetical protein
MMHEMAKLLNTGILTCTANHNARFTGEMGTHAVEITFTSLEDAQRLHRLLVELAQPPNKNPGTVAPGRVGHSERPDEAGRV